MRFSRLFSVPIALRFAGILSIALIVPSVLVVSTHGARSAQADPVQGGESIAGAHHDDKPNTRKPADPGGKNDAHEAVCLIVESAAKENGLPLEFFARVIWQESRFQSSAVGPVTRNGQRAQGIAQFMPQTSRERRLLDPFDPVQALPKAAEFLNELRSQFGNVGLAAAAYNAGPRRVQEWLDGSAAMPQETRNYVLAITGISIEDWAKAGRKDNMPDHGPKADCGELIALLNRAPNRFVAELEQSVRRAATKPWGVQVAAGFGRDQALVMYAQAMKGLSAVVARRDEPILFRSRGTSSYYQVRIGTSTHREADELCGRIRRTGGACLVKRRDA
jgi:transglycosylase-like protein with SLT domain/sporulation related protein